MKRKNKYPGVSRQIDRHGKVRWRYRGKGFDAYIRGEYDSPEFRANYARAKNDTPPAATKGSFSRLIDDYRSTTKFANLSAASTKTQNHILRRIRNDYGERSYRTLDRKTVERIMAKHAATPETANAFLKMFRRLYKFAQMDEDKLADPTRGVQMFKKSREGFHTWTDDEIVKFIAAHPKGTMAYRALMLLLCTGAARQDAAAMTKANFTPTRVSYTRMKTGQRIDLPILADLADVVAGVKTDVIIPREDGAAYSTEGFGNWFRKNCVAAGLPHCSIHGLRKAGAKRLAERGSSSYEIMSFLGHENDTEANTYVRAANRGKLADSGFAKLPNRFSGQEPD